ncbi:MAG: formate dehydrogenase subunit gamma [Rhodocyclaceae bacterium]|nr:formate dehydrogenase subunit gamma [Rhodocyclaceae bacterium]
MLQAHGFAARVRRVRALLAVTTLLGLSLVQTCSAAEPATPVQDEKAVAAQTQTDPPHNASATWRQVRSGTEGFTTVKGTETGVLVSSQGNTWRAVRNGLITPYGGAVLIIVAASIFVFYKKKGTIKLHEPKTGRKVTRFTPNERRAHWLVAISFVCLAFSGIVLLFGKHIFLWLLGYTLFSWLGWISKNLHILAGFSFLVGVVLLFGLFWKDNLWDKSDAEWIRKAGGILNGEHVPSRRFNFGEKTWFWIGVCLFGLIMIFSGLALTFPNLFETRAAMQYAQIIHATSACLVIAMSLGHIYMGTIGMEGAYDAMKTGEVDEAWAKEHHEIWYQEEVAAKHIGGGGGTA